MKRPSIYGEQISIGGCEELFSREEFGEEIRDENLNNAIIEKIAIGRYETRGVRRWYDRDGENIDEETLSGNPISDIHYKDAPEKRKENLSDWLQVSVKDEREVTEYDSVKSEEQIILEGLEIGSCLHEDWRQTRKNEDGTFEPRWKKVKDPNFKYVESDTCRKNQEGIVEIDIANRTFGELSEDWQFENLEAGKVVARLVGSKTQLTSFKEVHQMASEIHDEWLKRNDWVFDPSYGNPDQAVPYEELSDEEKKKDIAQLKFGIALNRKIQAGEISYADLKKKYMSKDAQVKE